MRQWQGDFTYPTDGKFFGDMVVKDGGVDHCGSVVWATDLRTWGAFIADSDAETTYVGERLGERGVGVVVEVVVYSLWIEGIRGKEGRVTGCDQGEARGGVGACGVGIGWSRGWAVGVGGGCGGGGGGGGAGGGVAAGAGGIEAGVTRFWEENIAETVG